jgi:tetratricopeptide (TPR) repeat protein
LKRTHRHWVRRSGWIGLTLLLGALSALGQTPDATPASPSAEPARPAPGAPELPGATPAIPVSGIPAAPLPSASLIERSWLAPATDLDARVARTQRTALELGAWSLDAAARSLAAGGAASGTRERAAAAVELAPDLPAAHMRLARALWLEDGAPIAAIRAVLAALRAIGRHLEASLWFAGCGLFVLAAALVAGSLIAAALAGTSDLAHAAHDLGHLLPRESPAFATWAGLAALLALPLALGEGGLGLALALLGLAVIYGGRAQRVAMLLAAAGIGLGAYPVIHCAGVALTALPQDPVAQAAFAVAQGIPTPVEVERLASFADRDALAARGLAIHARRTGDLARADALYQQLLATGADDISVQNNAADVQLALGHTDRAIELYGLAARGESPVVLFNLAQAYGRAFRVEELNQTISHAQRAGGELVARLTALQGGSSGGFVADLPPAPSLFWSRALYAPIGADFAQEFRDHFAAGRLGRDPRAFAVVAAACVALGVLFGARLQPSRSCPRCRERICRRCQPRGSSREVCDGCHALFFAPEKTDRALRAARVHELRAREHRTRRVQTALSLLVPGAAGLLADRPVRGWLSACCFSLAGAAVLWRDGVVPDPLVAGAAAPAVFLGIAALAAIAYLVAVATSLAAQRHG